ncbi:MAG: hypothetical protein Fur0028_06250 [Bacteroidales bacterium]
MSIMEQINYYELKKQLQEIKEAIVIFYGNAITKQKDIREGEIIELKRKSLLRTIEQIQNDYKRLSLFGGVQNLIHIASTVRQKEIFPDNTGLQEQLFEKKS